MHVCFFNPNKDVRRYMLAIDFLYPICPKITWCMIPWTLPVKEQDEGAHQHHSVTEQMPDPPLRRFVVIVADL